MNGDTPGSRPSDDVPFLGPAIPPRDPSGVRQDGEADALPPPFIPGTAWRRAAGAAAGVDPGGITDVNGDLGEDDLPDGDPSLRRLRRLAQDDHEQLAPDDQERLDTWPEDDFPWLVGMEAEEEAGPPAPDEATVVEALAVEAEFVVAEEVDAGSGSDPVDAAALPIEEWTEDGSSVETVETAPADPALIEVAERLERIAASLRSGRVTAAVEEGDPLRLLITGYALGYAQSRKLGEG